MARLKEPTIEDTKNQDPKVINNTQYILKDIIEGDTSIFSELGDVDMNQIKIALNFLLNNDKLSTTEKSGLLQDSWRVLYRAKPPTPEEFLTEKYLGPLANTIYPRIKKTFLEFMNPNKEYRNLILYPHIGWGKDQPLDSKVYISPSEYKDIKDIEIGDKVLSPDGSQTEVIAVTDWCEDEVYELEMDDGSKMKCGPHHLHNVSYRKDPNGNKIWENVETTFLIDHPELEFEFNKVNILS